MAATTQREWNLTQQAVNEAVGAAMESSLRDPILDAVERADGVDIREETADDDGSSTRTKALQGLVTFVVMFVVLYVVLRRLTADDSE